MIELILKLEMGIFCSVFVIPITLTLFSWFFSDKCTVCGNRKFLPGIYNDENFLTCNNCRKRYKVNFRGKIIKEECK